MVALHKTASKWNARSACSVLMAVICGMNLSSLSGAYVLSSMALAPSGQYQSGTTPVECDVDETIACSGSWRIALNFGRELSTPLWDSFGRSGIRFPVVVPCDFHADGHVDPQVERVSYVADIQGGENKPVEGGRWQLDKERNLEFTLAFPEEMHKQDVKVPFGSELCLQGKVLSVNQLKEFEDAFSEARKAEWKAREKVDEIQRIRDSPKKWNEASQRWEYPTVDEPLTSLFSKHWNAFTKGQETRKKFAQKPRSGVELSKRPGRFPGFSKDNPLYFGTSGVIRNKSQGNMVIGTWTAEPIDGHPASYL